jgi:hypothetical protein
MIQAVPTVQEDQRHFPECYMNFLPSLRHTNQTFNFKFISILFIKEESFELAV